MDNTFFNIIIGASAAIIGILAFTDEIGKSKRLQFIKSVAFKIIIFVIATFFGIWASVKKDSNTELQSKNEKIESQNEQAKKDSLNKIFTDESNRKIVATFTDVLVQYGLKYDSGKNEIITFIKDSSNKKDEKTVIGVCPSEIGIVSERINDNEIHIDIRICNFGNNPAYNANISAELLVKKSKTLEHNEFGKSPLNLTISTETRYVMKGKTNVSTMNWAQDTLYLFLKGTYFNYQKTTKQVFRELYVYDYSKNQWGLPPAKNDVLIIETLKSAKFY